MRRFGVLAFIFLFLADFGIAQKPVTLTSPDGKILVLFRLQKGVPVYSVSYSGKIVIDYSAIGLHFLEGGVFGQQLQTGHPVFSETDENYELVVGKAKIVRNHYREVLIPLREGSGAGRLVNFVIRAFNDGIAFRYSFPVQSNWNGYSLIEETTHFNIAGDPLVHALLLPNFTTSHEGHYSVLALSALKEDTLMDMPALFECGNHVFLGIAEARLIDYAGMYLVKRSGQLVSQLSPLPGQSSIKVIAKLPHQTPWRVVLISDRVGALIESNIVTNLNDPCKIKDLSWIRPGKTTFPWWNGNVVPDTLNAPGNNFVTAKYYIDFCAANHIEYHSVVEYGLHEWYTNDGISFMPGPHVDVTIPVPGLDMQQVCDYAKSKGVGIRVWVHWKALYPKLDTAFAQFEKWGISGMMVDFMDRDDQEMVNMQLEILQKAAAHHLHIQFHGAYKPTGLHRTYPNEYTREGTLNYEADKWNAEGISPDHDIEMPFTRMLAGSTDYHLGGFRAVPASEFRAQYTRPLMLGTRCHMLAMYVVLENYLAMVCDYPEAYLNQPGFDFIQQVPTVWDETKVIDAVPGKFVSIARRKGEEWYIGTISNHEPRDLELKMDFLGEGTYNASLYSDAADTDQNPNHLIRSGKTVTNKDLIKIHIAAGGGQVMRITKSK